MRKELVVVLVLLLTTQTFSVFSPKVQALSDPYITNVGISYEEYSTPITPPITQTPGGHMRLWYTVYNPNAGSMQVILGASLLIGSSEYTDPAHDNIVTIYSGSNGPNRYFYVPSGVPTGSYTVVFAIWATDWSKQYSKMSKSGWVNMVSSVSVQLSSYVSNVGTSNVGTITWDGVTYSLPRTVSTTTRIHWSGTDNIHCAPPSGHSFDHWEYSGAVDTWDASSQWTNVDVDGSGTLKAVFTANSIPPSLTLYDPSINDRTVTINGVVTPGTPGTSITRINWNWGDGSSGDSWFPASHTYSSYGGYTVTATAYQSDGLTTTQTKYVSLTAPQYTVTVNPNGGRVYVDGSPITSSTSYTWSKDSTHTLDPDSGYQPSSGTKLIFNRWSDGSTADPRSITVTGSATYTVEWTTQYQLTIGVSPTGAGTTNPATGTYWYNKDVSVTVTETPNTGYIFDHWELDGGNIGASHSCTVSMNAPHNLAALFKADIQISTPTVVNNLEYITDFDDMMSAAIPDGKYADVTITVKIAPSNLVATVQLKTGGTTSPDTITLTKTAEDTYSCRFAIADPNDWIDLLWTFFTAGFVKGEFVPLPEINWVQPKISAISVTDVYGQFHERNFDIPLPTAKDMMPWIYSSSTTIAMACPADMLVFDSQNRRVGAVYENGVLKEIVNEIPGAYYFGHIGSHTVKIIYLPYAIDTYRIEIIGYGSGPYNLTVFTAIDQSFNGSSITENGIIDTGQVIRDFLVVRQGGILYLAPTLTTVYEVVVDGKVFLVHIESNSTVSDFAFSLANKEINFHITGPADTNGFCNVTIPRQLLDGPFTLLIDGAPATLTIMTNATHNFLYFTYAHSTHNIQIIGTYVYGQPQEFTLSITTSVGGTTTPAPGAYTYDENSTIQVTAIPDAGYEFDYWILDGSPAGSANPISILMTQNHTLEAMFTQITYQLIIETTTGGTTTPTPGTYTYVAGSSIQVTANPNTDYILDHWELDGSNVGTTNSYTVTMNQNHTLKAVFVYSPPAPPLSASISPLSASVNVGQSVTFTSTVTGGTSPYAYQWCVDGSPVSGATSASWIFTQATSGIYYVYLKVTDAHGNTTQSQTARISVATVPVGGYSYPISGHITTTPLTLYLVLATLLASAFITVRRKTLKRKEHS